MKEEITNEIWKDIKGCENYQVSSNGVIRSLDRYLPMPNGGEKLVKGRIIKQYITPNGYMIVILGKKTKYVHRIVAEHFSKICGDWFEGCQVDHINCVRNDNRAHNLKVCTASENANNPLTLKHQSIKKLGKKMPIGFCEKISNILKGRKHTECSKEKISKANTNNPKRSKKVKCLDNGIIYPSTREIERQFGFKHSDISACCNGKAKSCGGFHWKYV